MIRIEIPRPNKPVNSMELLQESGFDLICIEDKFYLQGEATEAELLLAYDTHSSAKLARKVAEDAIKAQEALDRASGEAKLLAVGLTKAEIKAIRKE